MDMGPEVKKVGQRSAIDAAREFVQSGAWRPASPPAPAPAELPTPVELPAVAAAAPSRRRRHAQNDVPAQVLVA
jgi:hypothetical protein